MSELEERLRAARPLPPEQDPHGERMRALAREVLRPHADRRWRPITPRRALLAAAALLVVAAIASAAIISLTGGVLSEGPRAGASDVGALTASGQVSIWAESRGDRHQIVAARRGADGGWGNRTVLAADGEAPAVASDGSGGAVAAWLGGAGVEAARLGADGRWSAPERIPGSQGQAIQLRLAFGPDGTVTAAWNAVGVPNRAMIATHRDGHWQPAQELPRPPGADAFAPAVAIGAGGETVAAWQLLFADGRPSQVRAAVRPAGGDWSAPAVLASAPGAGDQVVAVDRRGHAVVAWSQGDGHHDAVMSASWSPGAGWSAPRALGEPANTAQRPMVAPLPEGAVVAWIEGPPVALDQQLRARVQATALSGEGVPQPAADASEILDGGITLAVATDADGGAALAWSRRDTPDTSVIEVAYRRDDGSFGEPIRVSEPGASVLYPSISLREDGQLRIVWTEERDGRSMVVTATLTPSG